MKITKIMAAAAALALGMPLFADEAYDIMKKSTTLKAPDFTISEMHLDSIEKNGSVDHQIMQQYGNRTNGLINTVFDFKVSSTNKGTRVLQMEKTNKDDDRWIYLPSLKTTRRIPTSDRYKSFVGCEFTYNDMSIRNADLDTHVLLSENESVTIDGNQFGGKWGKTTYSCWKIDSTPATPQAKTTVEYSHRISYIDKNTYLPVRTEFYDKKDKTKLIKTQLIEKIEIVKGVTGIEYPLRRSAIMINELTGRSARVYVGDFTWDKPLSDGYFTQNWLMTGKAK